MILDKFQVIKLVRLRSDFFSALEQLENNNLKGLEQYAKLAYLTNPNHINSHIIYGLSCVLSKNIKEGVKVFNSWHSLSPSDMLAKYGLADMLLRYDKREAAFNVLSTCDHDNVQLCQLLQQKLIHPETTTLLDQDFFDLYSSRLKLIVAMYTKK